MPTQLKKIEAHADHLLDEFIRLRERYALFHAMRHADIRKLSGHQFLGFKILRKALFLSCVQDIVKLSLDKGKRAPSLYNLVQKLTDASVQTRLRERFVVWRIPSVEEESDPDVLSALKRIELGKEAERRDQFDDLYCEATEAWSVLSTSPVMEHYHTIRNKVSAHTEVQHVADKYQPVDIAALGIKWDDLARTVETMQRLVELLGLLIRNACFAWDRLYAQLSKAASALWPPSGEAR